MRSKSIITLLTDFGSKDGYVGAMKGVILGLNPDATIVDLTHEISPGDIGTAAFVLAQAAPYFPSGTIHVIVVDPCVGSERRALAVEANNSYFLAPDNGVLKWIFVQNSDCRVIHLNESKYFLPHVSRTFHGRDVFAPVAAHLSSGVPFDDLGQPIEDFVHGEISRPARNGNILVGQIIYVDRFGNLISNITEKELSGAIQEIRIGEICLFGLNECYSQSRVGEPLAIIGSHGFLEIAVREGNAANALHISVGDKVAVLLAK